jgi:hypothetical protein
MSTIREIRRMPRSVQGTLVLAATGAILAVVLGTWLVLWLLLVRSTVKLVALSPDSLPAALQSLSGLVGPGVDTKAGPWRRLDLESLLKGGDHSDAFSGRPVILYVTAPVADVPSNAEVEQGVFTADAIRDVVRICQQERGNTKVLLIIDPGRVGQDRLLALKGEAPHNRARQAHNWLEQLQLDAVPPDDPIKKREWEKKWRNFGVLCASSPEQFSWPVEGKGRTIFDEVLNQSLAKPRRLRKTIKLVSSWVTRFVPVYIRGGYQNPMYFGDPDLDFFVRTESARPTTVVGGRELEEDQEKALAKRFEKAYERRDGLQKRAPYRHSPAGWRDYQARLLEAERLFRARRVDDAERRLGDAEVAARRLTKDENSPLGSLAMGIRYADDPSEYEKMQKQLESALEPEGPAPAPAPGPGAKDDVKAAVDQKSDRPQSGAGPNSGQVRLSRGRLFGRIVNPPGYGQIRWSELIEGQLIEWLEAYGNLPPFQNQVNLFSEKRKEMFLRAIALRLVAERSAATALDPRTALRWAIETGDAHLRSAQDDLFIDQGHSKVRPEDELAKAGEQYTLAATYVEAQILVGEIQSEFPFLAVWSVRRSARQRSLEIAERSSKRITKIAGLAQELDEILRAERPGPEGEDYFDRIARQRSALEKEYRDLRRDFVEDVKDAEGVTNWRAIDDVLLVPDIEVKRRVKLVERARVFPRLVGEDKSTGLAGTDDTTTPAKSAVAELGRAAFTRNLGRWLFEEGSAALDPKHQSGAGPDFEPSWIYDERPETKADESYLPTTQGMRDTESALRALGPARASSFDDRFQGLMTWMARRMINDADPVRAKKFSSAGGELEKERKPLEQTEWFSPFSSICREHIGVEAVPMKIEVQARPGIPAGSACLLVDFANLNDRRRLELLRNDRPIDRGTEVAVNSAMVDHIALGVGRAIDDIGGPSTSGRGPATDTVVEMQPMVFYRGRRFDADRSMLTLSHIESRFIISMKSDAEAIRADLRLKKGADLPADQFTKNANAKTGFAYPLCRHPSELTVLYTADDAKSVDVDVELEYDDNRKPVFTKLKLEPGKSSSFAKHTISFGNTRPRDRKVALPDVRYLRQQKLLVRVWKSGKIGVGNPLAQQTLVLSEINPESYNRVDAWYVKRVAYVRVRRGEDDPVVREVGVVVKSQDLGRYKRVTLPRKHRAVSTDADIDKYDQAGLLAGDSVTFEFALPEDDAGPKTYHFDVIFAGDLTNKMECELKVGAVGTRPIPQPAQPAAVPVPE